MARRKKRSSDSPFRGKVANNAHKQQGGVKNYLAIPKGTPIYNEPPGETVMFDILPYIVTDENHPDRIEEIDQAVVDSIWWKRPFKVHHSVGVNNETLVCPTSIGLPCPECEYMQEELDAGAEYDDVREMKASKRTLYAVVPIEQRKYDEVLHVWDISDWCFFKLLDEELQIHEEFEIFPDLENGYTLETRFTKKSFGNNDYAEAARIDFLERGDFQYDESMLDEVPDLDSLLIILSYDEFKAKFFEVAEEDDEEPRSRKSSRRSRGTRSRKSARRSSRRTRVEPEEEEYEDEEYDDTEEEEEDERPTRTRSKVTRTRRTKSRRSSRRTTEPEEEEEEYEEETEAAYVPGKRRPKPGRKKSTSHKSAQSRRKKSHAEKVEEECPYGHVYGVDGDQYDDCDDCELWDACVELTNEQA